MIRKTTWSIFILFALGMFSCNPQPETQKTAQNENSRNAFLPPRPLEQPEQRKRLTPLGSYRKGIVEVKNKHVRVYIADSPEKQQEGLMFVKPHELGQDEGMLFIFTDDTIRAFWMKNTEIPLDIAFLDKGGKIVRVYTMKPYDESSYSSDYPVRYALELHAGWLEKNSVKEGDTVKLVKIR
ncbi:MAG TPA: DUF192 domain-containing protein [Fimbriimonadales bacterium]|nr:DUF192 domain-containing protein [Fimbriimonadales bacterium]